MLSAVARDPTPAMPSPLPPSLVMLWLGGGGGGAGQRTTARVPCHGGGPSLGFPPAWAPEEYKSVIQFWHTLERGELYVFQFVLYHFYYNSHLFLSGYKTLLENWAEVWIWYTVRINFTTIKIWQYLCSICSAIFQINFFLVKVQTGMVCTNYRTYPNRTSVTGKLSAPLIVLFSSWIIHTVTLSWVHWRAAGVGSLPRGSLGLSRDSTVLLLTACVFIHCFVLFSVWCRMPATRLSPHSLAAHGNR